jgi:hypothetical protein
MKCDLRKRRLLLFEDVIQERVPNTYELAPGGYLE